MCQAGGCTECGRLCVWPASAPGARTVAGLCLDGVLPGTRLSLEQPRLCSEVTAEQEYVARCQITSRRHWGLGVHGARVGRWVGSSGSGCAKIRSKAAGHVLWTCTVHWASSHVWWFTFSLN